MLYSQYLFNRLSRQTKLKLTFLASAATAALSRHKRTDGILMVGRHKFYVSLKQSLAAYAFNICGVFAGTLVAFHLGLFLRADYPWIVAIYPAIVSARGVIGGLLSGRLSTGLHLGTYRPQIFNNTSSFYLLFKSVLVLTLETSVAMSLVASAFGALLWGTKSVDLFAVSGVIMATMTLALVAVSPITMIVASTAYRHGLDPDIVLYPVESTASDVLITVCYVAVLSLFFSPNTFGRIVISLLCLILVVSALYVLLRNRRKSEFTRTIKEAFLTLIFVAFIVNVTGLILGKISENIGSRREVYTVYPSLIDTIGDVGAVIGSTATTKLAIGTLKPHLSAIGSHLDEIASAWTASIVMFVIYSVLSLAIQGILTLDAFIKFTPILLTANVLAASSVVAISWVISIAAFRGGLDPDNVVIPIESSCADSVTTTSLFIALALLG